MGTEMDTYNRIETELHRLKLLSKGDYYSNIVPGKVSPNSDIIKFNPSDNALWFTVRIKNQEFFYFATAGKENLRLVMEQAPVSSYCSVFYKDTNEFYDTLLSECNWYQYAIYYRITIVYRDNPYLAPQPGRRAILQTMYDPSDGQVPELSDIPELVEILNHEFDPVGDDFYDEEEWKEIINRKECLVHKEDGKIISLYVWHIDRGTLYSSMIINYGGANISYNLERRVFDEAFSQGIRKHYWWLKQTNKKAVERHGIITDGGAIKNHGILYNAIYRKA